MLTNQEVTEIKNNVKRGKIREALQQLVEAHDGMITPQDVVNEARAKSSVLHKSFEWDNNLAGDKYRLMQARMMLSTVTVEYLGEKQDAYYNATITVGKSQVRGYFPLQRVMTEKEIHDQVLRQAIHDLEYAQQKYNRLKEFDGVINQKKLDQLKKKIK